MTDKTVPDSTPTLARGYLSKVAFNRDRLAGLSRSERDKIAADILTLARAALDVSGNDERWQPIETAPKDGATYLLLWGRYWSDDQGWMKKPLVGQFSGRRWEVFARIPFGIRPTHWQPLPEPPATIARTQEQSDG